jgi:hypothetical protein
MNMLEARLRYYVLYVFGLLLWLIIPILLILRIVFQTPRWFGKLSIWTGAPIITIPLKCKAERLLGWNARSVVRDTYHLTSAFDFIITRFGKHPMLQLLLCHIGAMLVALFARRVHSFVDGGLLPSLERRCYNPFELLLYRSVGIRQFFWTYGGDVRTRDLTVSLGAYNACVDCPAVMSACVCSQATLDRNLTKIRGVAQAVFTMGDMMEYVPGSNNKLFYWPVDAPSLPVISSPQGERFSEKRPLRVVHAANHRFFKGTRFLTSAVACLRQEGAFIELMLVEGLDNQSALKIYQSADVIFDQCLIGFHGYFALEAMALGKPVMCFVRDRSRYLLNPRECPIIDTNPETVTDDLRRLYVSDVRELQAVGLRSEEYVRRHFSVETFSTRLSEFYSSSRQPS